MNGPLCWLATALKCSPVAFVSVHQSLSDAVYVVVPGIPVVSVVEVVLPIPAVAAVVFLSVFVTTGELRTLFHHPLLEFPSTENL